VAMAYTGECVHLSYLSEVARATCLWSLQSITLMTSDGTSVGVFNVQVIFLFSLHY
jgi:hypothetical protein